jgi:hypothetical protein
MRTKVMALLGGFIGQSHIFLGPTLARSQLRQNRATVDHSDALEDALGILGMGKGAITRNLVL